MRVLFGSSPGVGHVQPMLPLALTMRARGHEVMWATGEDGCAWVRGAGLDTTVVGLPSRERMAEYERRWPELVGLTGEARAEAMFPRLFGAVTAHAAFPGLLALGLGWQPDVVVSEAGDFAAPVVAAALGVPQATHGFGLAVPPERVAAAAEWATALWDQVGLAPRPFGGCYDHLYIDIYPPSMQTGDFAHLGRVQRRRPASLTGADAVSPALDALLHDGRPLVYLTFGTVFNENEAFTAAVDALSAMDDLVTLVTVGPDGNVEAFGARPDHVLIDRYVPQHQVLPHCAAVVSHAGSGTLLGALALGVPQVCLPQAADQFRNAGACAAAGAGIVLVGHEATAPAIEAAVRRVQTDPAIRAAAHRISEEIASMPSTDEAAQTIESLAATRP